jgi:hypothetical protein
MPLQVVGAGVGRTGTHSLKLALEQLLGGPCHHMVEVLSNPAQIAGWTDLIEGRPVDWNELLAGYRAMVDWPGASYWREALAANPDALVLLSVRDADAWYRSTSDTILLGFERLPDELRPWMNTFRGAMHERFCDQFDDHDAMVAAFERHNDEVRREAPPDQLLEWRASDGWEPICARLGLPVPSDPFPVTNTTDEFRTMLGLPARS